MKIIQKLLIIACILVLFTACDAQQYMTPVDPSDTTEIEFVVPAGASAKQIARSLEDKGLIQKAYAFRKTVENENLASSLQAGKYHFSKAMSVSEIAQKIAKGDVYIDTFKFTIPEGYEYQQIVELLSEKGLIDREKFEQIAQTHSFDYKFLSDNPEAIHRLEGYLYPATYELSSDSDELAIITAMLDTFNQHFKAEYYDRATELGYTVDEIVTLASIIERETVVSDEMKLISAVFHNRLNDDYLLQADSTIQYVSGERKEKMLYSDIELDSPFNTYKYAGLTPSPICNPSIAAVEAALYPEESDYYYFVVTGDNDGRHNFSVTFEEHLKNQRNAEKKLGN